MLIISVMTVLPVVRDVGASTIVFRASIVILPVIIVRWLPAMPSTSSARMHPTTANIVAAVITTLIVMLCVTPMRVIWYKWLVAPSVIKPNVFGEPISHIFILLVTAWHAPVRTLVYVMILGAITALQGTAIRFRLYSVTTTSRPLLMLGASPTFPTITLTFIWWVTFLVALRMALRLRIIRTGRALTASFIVVIYWDHNVRIGETPMLLTLLLELVTSLAVACRSRLYCIVDVMVDFGEEKFI